MSSKLQVEFFYDVLSPYSFFAFEVFRRYQLSGRWDLDWKLRPFSLGGVMEATGNAPPASLPARAPYLGKDVKRNSDYWDLPLTRPAEFPVNTISPMRFLTVIEQDAPNHLIDVSRNFWIRYWSQRKNITSDESIIETCTDLGIDINIAKGWLEKSKDQEIMDKLKKTTDEAVSRGAFGAPTFFLKSETHPTEEMFFGSDRFPVIAHMFNLPYDGPNPKVENPKY